MVIIESILGKTVADGALHHAVSEAIAASLAETAWRGGGGEWLRQRELLDMGDLALAVGGGLRPAVLSRRHGPGRLVERLP